MTEWQPPERSFTTLQATVRDWGRHFRISDLQGLGGEGDRDDGEERFGRVQINAEDGPAAMLLPGANRCVGVFDQERAVLLRCEAWLDDELLMAEELKEVVFDELLDPQVFAPS